VPAPTGRKALGPVEFPGGPFLPGVPASQLSDLVFTRNAVETRTADARFVLDQLERMSRGENPDAEGNDLPACLAAGLDQPFLPFGSGETQRTDPRPETA